MSSRRATAGRTRDAGNNNGLQPVTRVEFDKLLRALEERDEMLDELRRAVHATCRDLADDVRRELQTQFTRIAQLQQEIDSLKRRL